MEHERENQTEEKYEKRKKLNTCGSNLI